MIEKIIISIVVAWFIAQIWKQISSYQKTGYIDLSVFFFQNGGMPSSHTSTTVALTSALYFETGLSYYFVISLLFTLIVINDSMKMRREVGDEARMINQMNFDNPFAKRLSERVGHTPPEVFVGGVLGIIIPIVVYLVF